jgi:hypothetical protein
MQLIDRKKDVIKSTFDSFIPRRNCSDLEQCCTKINAEWPDATDFFLHFFELSTAPGYEHDGMTRGDHKRSQSLPVVSTSGTQMDER